jgi:hypothetical protein
MVLEHFNPEDLDFGGWMEQRRQAFMNARIGNPCFEYSLLSTTGLVVMFVVYAKLWCDNRRILWVTAEQMADLYNQDVLSRAAAHEAITRYNQHIESCNRAFEAGESLPSKGFRISAAAESELERLRNELARSQALVAELSSQNESQAKTLASLSMRIDNTASSRAAGGAPSSSDVSQGDSGLLRHINMLQEQLYAAQKELRRLKGA